MNSHPYMKGGTVHEYNILHLNNGQFASDNGPQALNQWVDKAFTEPATAGMVLHFHGGLVSQSAGRAIAHKLAPIYAEAGALPLFFVWESGLLETIKNNGHEIFNEPLFKQSMKKVAKWAIQKLPAELGFKGQGQALLARQALQSRLDAWVSGQSGATDDLMGIELTESRPGVSKSALSGVDKDVLSTELEQDIESDDDFQDAYQQVYNGLYAPAAAPANTKGKGSVVASNSQISPDAAASLFERSQYQTKGLLSWAKIAKVMAAVVIRVIKRFLSDRDHGLYLTSVEEVLRALYADKVGAVVWNTMKKDTADAFKLSDQAGGYRLLREIRAKLQAGADLPPITLIGHSTGAVYIRHFLAAAAEQIPQAKFNLIFLAAAESYQGFASLLANHAQRIAHFRAFAMTDKWEQEDGIVPLLYPASLLYFVSGVLEDEVDKPLIGMQRFLNVKAFNNAANFPDIASVRTFFQSTDKTLIFSPSDDAEGCRSQANSHGGFDDDEQTLQSIRHILLNGYL